MTSIDIEITTAAARKTFADGSRTDRFLVEADGTVRAWDRVAGHYTVCHSLTDSQQARIRREARQSA